jgi:hypothetical protein
MITEVYHSTIAGLTWFQLPELANVTILTFARGGRIHKQVSGTPSGMEFKYSTSGRIDIDTNLPFERRLTGTSFAERLVGEIVYIKYKV